MSPCVPRLGTPPRNDQQKGTTTRLDHTNTQAFRLSSRLSGQAGGDGERRVRVFPPGRWLTFSSLSDFPAKNP